MGCRSGRSQCSCHFQPGTRAPDTGASVKEHGRGVLRVRRACTSLIAGYARSGKRLRGSSARPRPVSARGDMLVLPLGYRRWASHVLSPTEVRWYGGDRCRGMATVFCEGHNGNPAGLYSGLHPPPARGTRKKRLIQDPRSREKEREEAQNTSERPRFRLGLPYPLFVASSSNTSSHHYIIIQLEEQLVLVTLSYTLTRIVLQ